MASFSIPLSGLNADSTALNTIANNLSNMSTTGFKEQTTNFSDLFYKQVGTTGAGGEIQQGTGVQVASNSTDFTGGAISSTGIATDVAIDGTGFFVLNTGGGQQLYTRDGNFQLSSTGTLESTEGQGVMGYAATNGVIDTSGGLTNITIPTGQVMPPSATTSFSLTQNLNSASPVGTQATGQVQVYDSLGKSYEATVTYTNLGNNKWSYAITLPDTLSAAAATAPAATTLPVTAGSATASTSASALTPSKLVAGLNSTYSYNFGASGTVDSATHLTIDAIPITIPSAGETVSDLAGQINALTATTNVSASVTTVNGSTVLTITGPTATIPTAVSMGSVVGDLAVSTTNYNFGSTATVDAATSLTITGQNAAGQPSSITVTAGADEPVSTYYGQINAALATAAAAGQLTNVSASNTDNQLSITGAGIVITGSASQDLTASTISYNFGTSGGAIATVDSSTNLTITGLTAEGATATTVAPTIAAGETVAQYVTALTSALSTAGIAGVAVSSTAGGQLSITGANVSTAGSVVQDPVASANASGTLSFNSSGNLVGPTTNPSNITIAGLSDNAATLNMTWDLFGATGSGNISQTAAASGQSAQNQNGYTSGAYQSFAIGSDGIVSATYSNGQSQDVGQLAIATVSNQQGLVDVGSTEYQATANSGLATVGVASSGGRGSLEGSSLEASNVNISTEFSDLIVAQRAFEANAKSVTTFDTITQETINMIH
jgi:flagellar hook protein FlgE